MIRTGIGAARHQVRHLVFNIRRDGTGRAILRNTGLSRSIAGSANRSVLTSTTRPLTGESTEWTSPSCVLDLRRRRFPGSDLPVGQNRFEPLDLFNGSEERCVTPTSAVPSIVPAPPSLRTPAGSNGAGRGRQPCRVVHLVAVRAGRCLRSRRYRSPRCTADSSSSVVNGFGTKSIAPADSECTAFSTVENPVAMITGVCGAMGRCLFRNWNPSIPGIMISHSTSRVPVLR